MSSVALLPTLALHQLTEVCISQYRRKVLDRLQDGEIMGAEIFNAAFLSFTLVLVGLGVGYLLLKLTPDS